MIESEIRTIDRYLKTQINEIEAALKGFQSIDKPNRQTKQIIYNYIVKKDIITSMINELRCDNEQW